MSLTNTVREMHALRAELAAHEAAAKAETARIKKEIEARSRVLQMATEGLDAEKIALAKTVVFVRGPYADAGEDRASVISDAIKQLATGSPVNNGFGNLWTGYFGTKNYDRWRGQRSDHPYGMGPAHGYTCFAIGITEAKRGAPQSALTEDEIEAAIYYLTNVARVQAAEARAKAEAA